LNVEGRSLPHLRFKGQSAAVLLHYDGTSEGQTLPRTLANFLGRKKRIEYLFANSFGNAHADVPYGDNYKIAFALGLNDDASFCFRSGGSFRDGMSGVHEKIKENLVEIAEMTYYRRERGKIGFYVRNVLDLIAGHDQCAFDCFI
jgi:hypothetical protein